MTEIARWQTKRVIVEARHFDPGTGYDEACEVVGWCDGHATDNGCELITPDGLLYAAPGDWIIRLEGGGFFPLTPGIFGALLARHFPPFIPKDHAEALCLDEDADWEQIAARIGGTLRNREIADSGEHETVLGIPVSGDAALTADQVREAVRSAASEQFGDIISSLAEEEMKRQLAETEAAVRADERARILAVAERVKEPHQQPGTLEGEYAVPLESLRAAVAGQ